MSKSESEKANVCTSVIDWIKVKDTLPKTAWELLDDVLKAYESAGSDGPARAVELALREKTSALRRQFEALKKEAAK